MPSRRSPPRPRCGAKLTDPAASPALKPPEVTDMPKAQTDDGPKLNRTIQLRIGRGLREMYSALESEPVPDRLVRLVMELEEQVPRKRAA